MIRGDMMHTVCLGVALWINSPVLLWLCSIGHFVGATLSLRLRAAWVSFKTWVHSLGQDSSQRVFTYYRVHGPRGDYAEFQSKAWNTRLITNWLDHEAHRVALAPDDSDDDDEAASERRRVANLTVTLIWLLNESFHVSEASGRFFTQPEADHYCELVESTLRVYKELAGRALAKEELVYPMRPKLHAWHELALTAKVDLANPRFFHCFADEDHLRVVLRAARASPRATMAAAVVRRHLLKLALVWSGRGLRRIRRRSRWIRRRARAPIARL
jgi:hypothetical protein